MKFIQLFQSDEQHNVLFQNEARITDQARTSAFQFVYMALAIDIINGHDP